MRNIRNSIVLVIPVKNEAESIKKVILEARRHGLRKIVVGVDPSTTDKTSGILDRLKVPYKLAKSSGYDPVVHSAILKARKIFPDVAYYLFADAGRKYSFSIIKKFEKEIFSGKALVLGVRSKQRKFLKWHQKFGTGLFLIIVNLFFGTEISDISSLRLIDANLLYKLNMKPRKFSYPLQMLIKVLSLRVKVGQIKVENKLRIGKSKVSGSLKNSFLAFLDMLRSLVYLKWKPK